jgi:hypothetical protein
VRRRRPQIRGEQSLERLTSRWLLLPVRDRAMRAHLATCSVLQSSPYRKYGSSLRPCARVDLHPPPAITLTPPEARRRTSLRSSACRTLSPSPLPERYPLGWGGENENPLRDEERSDSAHLVSGDGGAIAGGGSVSARAQGRREEAYFLYADDRRTEHAARRALIARSAHGVGPVRPRVR